MEEMKFLKGKLLERIDKYDKTKTGFNAQVNNIRIDELKTVIAYIDGIIETVSARGSGKEKGKK